MMKLTRMVSFQAAALLPLRLASWFSALPAGSAPPALSGNELK